MLINEVALLAGVSQRTLRYYDEIGLLTPAIVQENGYRQYNEQDLDRLQQILFYRTLDFSLKDIQHMMEGAPLERTTRLYEQKRLLEKKRQHFEQLVQLINRTLQAEKDGIRMTNEQKFEAFKTDLIEENEKVYGDEVRAAFGEHALRFSHDQLRDMTEAQYKALEQLEKSLFERLAEAMETNDTTNEVAMEVAELHKRWLQFYWKKYTKEAHAGLALLYMHDARFIMYYDKRVGAGATKFLSEIIREYTKSV